MANSNPGNPFYFIDDNHNGNIESGSNINPKIFILDKNQNGDCYKLNGNSDIYGIIYLDDGCDMKGMGNFTLYGSIVSDGSINKITGSPSLNEFKPESWNYLIGLNENSKSFMVPGTWRDFEPQP